MSTSPRLPADCLILGGVNAAPERAPDPGDWWLFQRLSTGERADRLELDRGESSRANAAWLGYWCVEESIDRAGEEALDVVLRLLNSAPPEQGHIVGAGPLEDLINAHGDALAGRIEELARPRPEFAACLGCVAVDDTALEPHTLSRLTRWVRTG